MPTFEFEEFDVLKKHEPVVSHANEPAEENQLNAFEQGYKAGWDDAVAAQSKDQSRITADLARNLQDLSFTYHEAHAAILENLKPVLIDMAEKVLPSIAADTLCPIVLEQMMELASDQSETIVELVASPANIQALELLPATANGLELQIREEPSLAPGQVYLRLGAVEKQIDLDAALREISNAVQGFFALNQEETKSA